MSLKAVTDIDYFYHITSVENIKSIILSGCIYPRNTKWNPITIELQTLRKNNKYKNLVFLCDDYTTIDMWYMANDFLYGKLTNNLIIIKIPFNNVKQPQSGSVISEYDYPEIFTRFAVTLIGASYAYIRPHKLKKRIEIISKWINIF